MCPARLILVVLIFFGTLGGTIPAFAFGDSPSMATRMRNSAAFQSSAVDNVLDQIAVALSEGSEAMLALRGSPEDAQKYRLQPPLPGMNCGIDRILSYISCYSSAIDNKKEAENTFKQLVDDIKDAMPSDRWGPVEAIPRVGSVRSISYQDGKTGARIDVELLVTPTTEAHNSYVISLYGWTRI